MLKLTSPFCKILGLLVIISIAIIAFAKINSSNDRFEQAKDFPEGALVYAQFKDLPALYKIWEESELKQKYLESTNFAEFQNNHLALKLISRLDEFEAAGGFPLGISTFLNSSESKAAIAVYDIGRLEFVFVAPLSKEKSLLSEFVFNKSGFNEETLPDGTVYYSKDVDADSGRQRQKLLFALSNGRFVLATDEVKLFKTLSLIKGNSKEKSLSEAPEFRALRDKLEPHDATIWVDQRKLNDDWYFKHYWAFGNRDNLINIRSGIFDFEIQENKIFERRSYLLNVPRENPKLSTEQIATLQNYVPDDIPYVSIQSFGDKSNFPAAEIGKTLLDGLKASMGVPKSRSSSQRFEFNDYSARDWTDDNEYLGEHYDTEINEDDRTDQDHKNDVSIEAQIMDDLNQIIKPANPTSFASLIDVHLMPVPLFFECRRGLVLNLVNERNLDREKLEKAISTLVFARLTVSGSATDSTWRTVKDNGHVRRELDMPMLGWKLNYSVQNNLLIFANSEVLMNSMFEKDKPKKEDLVGSLDELTTIRFDRNDEFFGSIMAEIRKSSAKSEDSESIDFFVDNVGGLFGVLSNVNQVRIKRSSARNILSEELEFRLE